MRLNIRRRIEGVLSEGRGTQLLWLICIIIVSIFVLWGISRIQFGINGFRWQEIIALCLDPGVFGGPGEHDGYRLIVTLVGMVLFAAMLISVVSNIFENISDQFKKGEIRYHFKNHILIIGSSHILNGLLLFLSNDEQKDKFGNRDIVIMADQTIEDLRDQIKASMNDKKLLKRITFYYDKRDNLENLKRAYVSDAKYIFIIGEDQEENHDLLNLKCLSYIRNLLTDTKTECFVLMNSQTTMKAYQNILTIVSTANCDYFPFNEKKAIPYNEIIFNINECRAEFILKNTLIKLLNFQNDTPIYIVIFGMTAIGRAIATTLAYYLHFNNHRNTIITIIDSDIKEKVINFVARNNILFNHSIYKIQSEDFNVPICEAPNTDIFWNFINSSPSSPELIKSLERLLNNTENCTYVCYNDIAKNLATEVAIRNQIKGVNIYADFGEYDEAFTMINGGSSMVSNEMKSKGFGCYSYDYYRFIFSERHKAGINQFFSDCNKKDKEQWMILPFAEKQKYTYRSNVSHFAQDTPTVINRDICNDYINYLMGLGKEGDCSHFFIRSNPNYMSIIRQHYHEEEIPYTDDFYDCIDYHSKELWDDYLLVRSYYVLSLNNNIEGDLCDFLNFERDYLSQDSVTPSGVYYSDDILEAILKYVNNQHILSDDSIEALGKSIVVDNFTPELEAGKDTINKIKSILQELVNHNNPKACLALASISGDNYEEQKELFNKAVSLLQGEAIPTTFFDKIDELIVEKLFVDTDCVDCLSWLIKRKISKINFKNCTTDYITDIENYVTRLIDLRDENLFYRLATATGALPCYQGAWLTKAYNMAKKKNNVDILHKVCLDFGNYFYKIVKYELAQTYYKEAYELINDSETILLYGRYLFWSEQKYEQAIEIGYDPYHDPTIDYGDPVTRQILNELEWIRRGGIEDFEDPYMPSNEEMKERAAEIESYLNEEKEEEKEKTIILQLIMDWETKYPNINHPYNELAQLYFDME